MKSIFFALLISCTFAVSGCNTMKGFGKDVQKVGGKIENAATK
ncbi:hypothetical protein IGB42_03827 [Andreprevotia sp. IGB-42]|nr:entericidin A/B family lipoprotein [Andreprevotia sp. IGB-42]KAF0811669.1 hypothetical protein IGB42_03827 [Andreprevotia sp. IGB-42]